MIEYIEWYDLELNVYSLFILYYSHIMFREFILSMPNVLSTPTDNITNFTYSNICLNNFIFLC